MPSRWVGSNLAVWMMTTGRVTMTYGPARTRPFWLNTGCTCLPPKSHCQVTMSPTTHHPSTCSPTRRCVFRHGGVLYSKCHLLLPVCLLVSLTPQQALWEQQDPVDRKYQFVPRKFSSLRQVPAYSRFIHERFERCLDLYLCPRQRKMRVTDTPEIHLNLSANRETPQLSVCVSAGQRQSRGSDPQTAQTQRLAAISNYTISGTHTHTHTHGCGQLQPSFLFVDMIARSLISWRLRDGGLRLLVKHGSVCGHLPSVSGVFCTKISCKSADDMTR